QVIDEGKKELEPLKSFVLPGGGKIGAYLHQCRTVCRRAEREILRLSRVEELSEWPLKYVNRLSDLFFVLSRWISKQTGEGEYLWQRGLAEKKKESEVRSQRSEDRNRHGGIRNWDADIRRLKLGTLAH